MRKFLSILFLFLPVLAFSQAIVKGGGIVYTNGAPTHSININTDAEVAIDTASGYWYERSRDGLGWILAGFRLQKHAGTSPPSATPLDKQSEVLLNDADSLYRWRAGSWRHINKVLVYTAGTGISVTGTVIANTGDLSITNEGNLTVAAGSATTSIINSNTSGSTGVTLTAAGILAISESGNVITLTATEVDGSTSNELQTFGHSGTTSYTNTLSNGGGSFTLQSSGIITISNSSGTVTIGATEVDGSISNEGSLTVAAGTGTTSIINSNTSGSTGVTIEAGTNVTISETGNTITIAASGGGGTTDLTFTGTSSPVTLNSSTGTDVTFTAGTNVTLSATSGNITINSTEVDGSISNEGSLTVAAGTGTTSIINSNTSGQTGVTLTAAGVLTISESGNVITLTATEVDGSVSNEGSLTVAAGTSTTSIINSNTSGQTGVTIEAGTNVTISETGNTITIAASGGGGTTDLTFSGTSSPVTLNSSTGTDVTFTAGTGISLAATSGNITINATGGGAANYQLLRDDGSDMTVQPTANFVSTGDIVFTLTNDGANTETEVSADVPANAINYAEIQQVSASRILGNPTGSAADVSEISLAAGLSFVGTALTPADASATNELQTLSNTSNATSHTTTLSNSGGSTQFVEGSGITLSTSGTGLDGILTITAVDASTTNEALTVSDGTDSEALGGQTLTFAATGIATVDYVIATNTLSIGAVEVDGSINNEGSLTVAAGTGTTSIINSNTSGQTGVTLTAAGVLTISESGNVITLTATEVDGSTTNEVLTVSDGTDSEALGGQTLTFAATGIATVDYVPGTNTLSIGAVEVDGSVSNEGSLTVAAGTGTTSIINSNTSGQTGVTLTAAGVLAISESGNVITLTATEVDGSISNEGSLTVAAGTGTTSIINSNTSGQTGVTLTAAGILAISESGNVITLTATEVDGSTTNELQTLASTSNATSHTVTLSSSGGSFQLVEGSGITLTTSGTGLDGIITIAATGGGANYQLLRDDGSDMTVQPTANFVSTGDIVFTLTNDGANTETEVSADIPANAVDLSEIQTIATGSILGRSTAGTGNVEVITVSTGLTISGGNITANDASASNEGSLTVNAGSGTTSVISSNTSGSTDVTLTAGSGISISETGNNITIAATGGGGGAPTDAQYLTLSTNATLTDERVLTAGTNISITDAGAGSTLTVDVLGGNQTTSQFTADQDNFSPTNWSTRTTHYVSSDATIRAITSFSALADGTLRRLVNTGSHPIYIPGEHPDGTAANRVITDCDIFIPPNGGVVTIFYDSNVSRWRIEKASFDPASQGVNGAYGHYYNFSVGATITGDWPTLTLVGNNDVSAPTTALLGGYSSNTSTSASGQGSFYFTDVQLNPTEYGLTHSVASALVQITANLSTSAQRYTAQMGFIPTPSSTTLAVNNSIGIRYSDNINSGNWEGFTRNSGGTESTVDLGVTAAVNTGYVLTVCVDKGNTEARFYINGVFRGRITSNLPASGADYGFRVGIWKSVGTTLRDIVTPWATFYTVKGF